MLSSLHLPSDTRIFQKEARTLAEAGHSVTYIAPGDRESVVDGVRLRPLPRPRGVWGRILTSTVRMLREAMKARADVYHFHDPELVPVGLALKLLGARVVYDAHEDLPKTILWKSYLPPWIRRSLALAAGVVEKTASRTFDLVVVAGESIQQSFRGHPRTLVIRNYPLAEQFRGGSTASDRDGELTVVYAGGLTTIRGAVKMVEAIQLVNGSYRPKLLLCGKIYPAQLEAQVRALPGFARADYRGLVPYEAMPGILAEADVGLVCLLRVPNYVDSEPTKMFEYMAAGLPVIASDFPAWRRIVEGADCGICVDPEDPSAIAGAIEFMAAHPDRRAEMGENGRRAVLERYNWAVEGRRLLEAYSRLG